MCSNRKLYLSKLLNVFAQIIPSQPVATSVARLMREQGLGRPRGPLLQVPSGVSLHWIARAARSTINPRVLSFEDPLPHSTEHLANSSGLIGHFPMHWAKSIGPVTRSPSSPRSFEDPLPHSTEHLANSSGLIGHLPMHWAKSIGPVIRSPSNPRSFEDPLPHSTEHLANSRGLMGHLPMHWARSIGPVMRSPRNPRSWLLGAAAAMKGRRRTRAKEAIVVLPVRESSADSPC